MLLARLGPRRAYDDASSACTTLMLPSTILSCWSHLLSLLMDSQARALDAVLKEVNLRFGKGSIMKLGSTPTKVYAPL